MPKEIVVQKETLFSLPLRRFLERYLFHAPNMDAVPPIYIDAIDAEVIAAIDPTEQFIHIEWKDLDTGEPHKEPKIWWINAWRTSYRKWTLDKEKKAKERKEANLLVENTDRIAKAMAKEWGLDKEQCRGLAYKIAKAKHDEAASKIGVIIDKG